MDNFCSHKCAAGSFRYMLVKLYRKILRIKLEVVIAKTDHCSEWIIWIQFTLWIRISELIQMNNYTRDICYWSSNIRKFRKLKLEVGMTKPDHRYEWTIWIRSGDPVPLVHLEHSRKWCEKQWMETYFHTNMMEDLENANDTYQDMQEKLGQLENVACQSRNLNLIVVIAITDHSSEWIIWLCINDFIRLSDMVLLAHLKHSTFKLMVWTTIN